LEDGRSLEAQLSLLGGNDNWVLGFPTKNGVAAKAVFPAEGNQQQVSDFFQEGACSIRVERRRAFCGYPPGGLP
jgi:hypothetical protein